MGEAYVRATCRSAHDEPIARSLELRDHAELWDSIHALGVGRIQLSYARRDAQSAQITLVQTFG